MSCLDAPQMVPKLSFPAKTQHFFLSTGTYTNWGRVLPVSMLEQKTRDTTTETALAIISGLRVAPGMIRKDGPPKSQW